MKIIKTSTGVGSKRPIALIKEKGKLKTVYLEVVTRLTVKNNHETNRTRKRIS